MAAPLVIGPLANTSPTLADEMKLCRLRAGLASCRESASWVLHDPRLWLGTALHSLLEKARHEHISDLEAAWDGEIAGFVQRIGSHQFDQRFSDPSRWPSYFLIRQRALSSAAELIATRRPSGGSVEPSPMRSGTERRLVARGGRLVGRPDRFDRSSVTDIKSNLPDQTTSVGAEIFKRNRRQIQIYAAIIAESLGFWPKKGNIIGASGETAEFGLVPAECNAEADAAVADLATWNRALASTTRASDIASPSDSSCGTCRFQLVCPAFWTWLARRSPGGTPPRAPVAAAGLLKSVQLGTRACGGEANFRCRHSRDVHSVIRRREIATTVRLKVAAPSLAGPYRKAGHQLFCRESKMLQLSSDFLRIGEPVVLADRDGVVPKCLGQAR
jgi:hypothetical protein